MKALFRISFVLFLSTLFLLTVACDTASNDLMEGASPSTSALALYQFDGETVTRAFVFEENLVRQILDELGSVRATELDDWSLNDITLPIFGFRMGTYSGETISVAWSNGYWITQDGRAYSFDFDFDELQQDYDWTSRDSFTSFTVFPNARLFVQDDNGWDSRFLTPAPPIVSPAGIIMTLNSWEDNIVSVDITNNNDVEWMYGQSFALHVFIGGVWYEVPTEGGNWAFTAEGLIVPPGETIEHIYNLQMFGNLPYGIYRIFGYGLSVELTDDYSASDFEEKPYDFEDVAFDAETETLLPNEGEGYIREWPPVNDFGITIVTVLRGDDPLLEATNIVYTLDYNLVRVARGSTPWDPSREAEGWGTSLLVRTEVPLYDFSVIAIANDIVFDTSVEDNPEAIYIPGTIIYIPLAFVGEIDVLAPGEGFLIHNFAKVGTLPWSGISFVDETGLRHYFAMMECQCGFHRPDLWSHNILEQFEDGELQVAVIRCCQEKQYVTVTKILDENGQFDPLASSRRAFDYYLRTYFLVIPF